MIYFTAETLGGPDFKIVRDLAKGMPIAGPVGATPGLTERKRSAQMSYTQRNRGIPERNKAVIERVTKTQWAELAVKCWGGTLIEVDQWWITEPAELTDTIARTIPLTPRYAINEQHGNQQAKIRLIGDFRASEINSIVETEDTDVPDSLDAFVAVASYYKILAPRCELMCVFGPGFRTCLQAAPIQEDQKEFATILLAPPPGPLKVATLRTQPFGSRRAPTNWPRATLLPKWIMSTIFRVVISEYVYRGNSFSNKMSIQTHNPSKIGI